MPNIKFLSSIGCRLKSYLINVDVDCVIFSKLNIKAILDQVKIFTKLK